MFSNLGRIVILIEDYDQALQFYSEKLGFEKIVDIDAGERRYLHIRLPGQGNTGIWLMKAESDAERARIGNQTAGQPCMVFYTDDFNSTYNELVRKDVRFVKAPREEAGATFAHFVDLYGNEIIMVHLPEE
jgi:predicted enzyme related to lactoylglutathione lyase